MNSRQFSIEIHLDCLLALRAYFLELIKIDIF